MSIWSASDAPASAQPRPPLPAAGWFGKIPALGDFASRRLPPEFVEPWDDWLSEGLFEARQVLGADWSDTYRNAPVWRFALTQGVLSAHPWFGILMPSGDRVGRQYPLTFAASFELRIDALEPWWASLIGVAIHVAEPGCDAEALEQALTDAAPAAHPTAVSESYSNQIAPILLAASAPTSLWWCWRPQADGTECVQAFDGLPRGECFAKLLLPPASDQSA
jgi:type VI secretion system protein ImpM